MGISKYTIEQKELAIKLRKEGWIYKDIAQEVGVEQFTTLRNWFREAGLKIKAYPEKDCYESGQHINNFTILGQTTRKRTETGREYTRWECQCDCGTLFLITGKQIHRGQKSCGCLTTVGQFKRLDSKEMIGRVKFTQYKAAAKRRDIDFELSEEEFRVMIYSKCHYCGSPPILEMSRSVHTEKVNGVDRMNSDVGYHTSNCVPCCVFCNRCKGDATYDEFMGWIKNLQNKGRNEISPDF